MVATIGKLGLLVAMALVAKPQQDPTPLKPVLVLTAQAPLDGVYDAVRQVFVETCPRRFQSVMAAAVLTSACS